MASYEISGVGRLAGISAESAPKGETLKIIVKGTFDSSHPDFSRLADEITRPFLGDRVPREEVSQLVAVIHGDGTAHVRLNEVPLRARTLMKRSIKAGEIVRVGDIADIERLVPEGLEMKAGDSIVVLFRNGWRFGLYFNLLPASREGEVDRDEMERALGGLMARLLFWEEWRISSDKEQMKLLEVRGWFPFVEILGGECGRLSRLLAEPEEKRELLMQGFLETFDSERLERLLARWIRVPALKPKEPFLRTAVDSFLRGDSSGYIGCIKVLAPEIEGVLRIEAETALGRKATWKHLIWALKELGRERFTSGAAPTFPKQFYGYLDRVFFRGFDLAAGDVTLSRHTATHGVAAPELYTREAAVRMILTLDHIALFLPHAEQVVVERPREQEEGAA